MSEEKINIKVYSDSSDLVPVTSALKQLELKGFLINVIYLNEVEISDNDIVILNIESLDSAHLKNFILKKKSITNKVIIIIRNTEALLVTSLLKHGFIDVFVFP